MHLNKINTWGRTFLFKSSLSFWWDLELGWKTFTVFWSVKALRHCGWVWAVQMNTFLGDFIYKDTNHSWAVVVPEFFRCYRNVWGICFLGMRLFSYTVSSQHNYMLATLLHLQVGYISQNLPESSCWHLFESDVFEGKPFMMNFNFVLCHALLQPSIYRD